MANVLIHNVSDRENIASQPLAFTIGGISIRPGKSAWVPVESIDLKTKQLHGKCIWIGDLPDHLLKKIKKEAQVSSMDREAVGSYLNARSLEELKKLNNALTPPFMISPTAPKRRYVFSILAACFSDEKELDPASFFWLGRWKKLSSGDYQEI